MKPLLSCLLLTLAALISPLPAAVVVQFSSDGAPQDESLPVAPEYVIGRSVNVSGLASSSDLLERLSGSLTYRGWDAKLDLNKYVSFTVTPDDGYSLYLTHLSFETLGATGSRISSFNEITSYVWAYRINQGNGYSAWTFSSPYAPSDSKDTPLTWNFNDFQTTGTVEFGLFATSDGRDANLSLGMVNVTGVVPEPAPAFLFPLSGSLALLRRRRASHSLKY
jgi:hypothetical protein